MALATARLSFFLACLLLRDHTVLLAHGSRLQLLAARRGGQRGGRRGAKHTAAQLVSEIQNAELSAFTSTAPDLSAEDFLASCNFSTADLPGELVKWHNAASACSILGKLDWLVLVGDSLTRQLFEALLQLLRADLPRGAMRPDVPADVVERCTCNEQANQDCRIHTEAWPASLAWLEGAPLVSREIAPCPNAPTFRMQFFHQYADWTHEAASRDAMTQVRFIACQHPNSLVYVAGAPAHEQRDTEEDPWVKMEAGFSIRHLIEPMRLIAEQCAVPPQNLVWGPVHWMDMEKVPKPEWREHQYPKDILAYNRETSAAARVANLTVFDTFDLTQGGATLDGAHVAAPVSLAKLQRLIGWLEARQAAPEQAGAVSLTPA